MRKSVERLQHRVVMRVMKISRAICQVGVVAVAVAATACARPVLYYPTPEEEAPSPAATAAAKRPESSSASVVVASPADAEYLRTRSILVPVAGADMSKVDDSFYEPRDGGRVHRAID